MLLAMKLSDSQRRRILIAGDSLFAESLAHSLGADPAVTIVGTATCVETAVAQANAQVVDAIVVAGIGADALLDWSSHLWRFCRHLPLIYADLNDNSIQLITTRRIEARTGDLLAAIATLPRQP
jgi:hypothetical protein